MLTVTKRTRNYKLSPVSYLPIVDCHLSGGTRLATFLYKIPKLPA